MAYNASMDPVFWQQLREDCGVSPAPEPLSTVTVFGYHYIPEHWHFLRDGHERNDGLLYLTIDGSARINHAGKKTTAEAGSVTLYFPGEDHDYETDRWEAFFFHFHPSEILKLALHDAGITHGRTWHQVMDPSNLARIDEIRTYPQPAGVEHYHRCAVLTEDVLYRCVSPRPSPPLYRKSNRVFLMMTYLREHLSEPHRVEDLAKQMSLSPSRFTHLFREEVGMSPMQYLRMLRMERARHLMRVTDLPINQIAQDVGFPDPLYFRRAFKQHFNQTPSTLRAQDRA